MALVQSFAQNAYTRAIPVKELESLAIFSQKDKDVSFEGIFEHVGADHAPQRIELLAHVDRLTMDPDPFAKRGDHDRTRNR
jgi:hypothetical protein